MYLKIKSDTDTKQYTLTDSFAAPYMHVSGSVLPLTTSTIAGLHVEAKLGDQTYRPLEYGSASASATYYTSAVNSAGLSSTTALTRASTSDTSYLTRASTSGTSYGTRSSTSGTTYTTTTAAGWYVSSVFNSNNSLMYTSVTKFGQDFKPDVTSWNSQYGYVYFTFISTSTDGTTRYRTKSFTLSTGYTASTVSNKSTYGYTNAVTTSTYATRLPQVSFDPKMTQPYPQPYSGTSTLANSRSFSVIFSSSAETATTSFERWYDEKTSSYITSRASSYYYRYYTLTQRISATVGSLSSLISTTSATVTLRPAYAGTFSMTQTTLTYKSSYQTIESSYSWYTQNSGASSSRQSTITASYSYSGQVAFRVYNNSSLVVWNTGNFNSIKSTIMHSSNVTAIFLTTNFYSTKYESVSYNATSSLYTRLVTFVTATSSSIMKEQYLTRSSTSGTTYLTRSSTSGTSYLTRSSTSGYSGVSSSSSESSGWK